MDISGIRSVFPSEDEDEEGEYNEVELMQTEETRNNNATLPVEHIRKTASALSALPGQHRTHDRNNDDQAEPHCSKDDPPQGVGNVNGIQQNSPKHKASNRFA